MNPITPKQETKLRHLIALKRFECPPPGHQELQASKIISRLEAEKMRSRLPWGRRWIQMLDFNPFLTAAYSCVVMGLLALGWQYGEHFEIEPGVKQYGSASFGLGAGALGKVKAVDASYTSFHGLTKGAPFGLKRPRQGSSIQPVVHIPGSPVPWLRQSMPLQISETP